MSELVESVDICAIQDVRKDDIVIAFMGPTGVGKSHFIDLLTGQEGKRAGCTLVSATYQVEATRVQHKVYGDRIVLVDTPGLDNTAQSEADILGMIAEWFKRMYEDRDIVLSGLIYLHRITDNRMPRTPLNNLHVFGRLCGDSAMSRVTMVTTMWDELREMSVGEERERELEGKFWKPLIDKGCQADRLDPVDEGRAWGIVERLIVAYQDRERVLLQGELVELKQKLNEVKGGKAAYEALQNHLRAQIESLSLLLEQYESIERELKSCAEWEKGKHLKRREDLIKQFRRDQEQLGRSFDDLQFDKMHISLGRRIKMLFRRKSAYAKSVAVRRAVGPAKVGVGLPSEVSEPEAKSPEGCLWKKMAKLLRAEHGVDKVALLMAGLEQTDAQLMADYMDMVLRTQEHSEDTQNRVLTLLSRTMSLHDVVPSHYKLDPIKWRHESKPLSGSQGTIYRGFDDDSVCVKVLYDGPTQDYLKELILWAHRPHSNILPLYGVFFTESPRRRLVLASPWMANGNLEAYVRHTPLSQKSRILLLLDIIDGLAYIHRINIVHGDLKGRNILISDQGRAMIADFGSSHISTNTAPVETLSPLTCTWQFSAPEILDSASDGHRPEKPSDIWSFGCLCYQVLSRKHPYYNLTRTVGINKILLGIRPQRPTRAEGWDEIDKRKWRFLTKKCWAVEPSDRPGCQAIRHIIEKWETVPDHRPRVAVLSRPASLPLPANTPVDIARVDRLLNERILQASISPSTLEKLNSGSEGSVIT